MYLSMIGEIDEEWDFEELAEDQGRNLDEDDSADDDEAMYEEMAVGKFHRWRICRELKTLYQELGQEKWDRLRGTFASVRNCGYSLKLGWEISREKSS